MAVPRRAGADRVHPTPRFGCERSKNGNGQGSVLRLALKNRRHHVVEGHPPQFDIHFLCRGAKIRPCGRQPARQKNSNCLVAAARTGEKIQQEFPISSDESGLFQQLSLRSVKGIFMGDVENASWQLPFTCSDGMTVLSHQQNAVVLVEGDDRDRTTMGKILSRQDRVAILDFIGSNIPHKAPQIGLGREHPVVHPHIRQLISQFRGLLFVQSEFG